MSEGPLCLGLGIGGAGFGVQGRPCVWVVAFGVQGAGFRVQSFGFRRIGF